MKKNDEEKEEAICDDFTYERSLRYFFHAQRDVTSKQTHKKKCEQSITLV